jgi:cytidine deaminase
VLDAADSALVLVATQLIAEHEGNDNHTVAAAARDRVGNVHRSLNLYHPTGGPCAELAVMAVAASTSGEPLTTIVAVGDHGRGVLAPCGRCRQILYDYFPDLRVVLPGDRALPIAELLPDAFVWPERDLREL